MDSTTSQVTRVFNSKGVPNSIWEPIAMTESGGRSNIVTHDPNSTDPNAQSYGEFQLNYPGGEGNLWTQYATPSENTVSQVLTDPVVNAEIASGPIAQAYAEGKAQGLVGANLAGYVGATAQRPGDPQAYAKQVESYYNQGYGTKRDLSITTGPITDTSSGAVTLSGMDSNPLPASSNSTASGGYKGFAGAIKAINTFENPPSNWVANFMGIHPTAWMDRGIIVACGLIIVFIAIAGIGFKGNGMVPIPIPV